MSGRTIAVAAAIAALGLLCVGAGAAAPDGRQSTAPPATSIYVCPMHLDVRSPHAGTCPRCGMMLVRQSARAVAYHLDLTVASRRAAGRQAVALTFLVRDAETGEPVSDFELVHERVFHLFVVSNDLHFFTHVHPTLRPDGRLVLLLPLPHPGAYQLYADFTPAGAPPQLVQRSLITRGYRGTLDASRAHVAADVGAKTDRGITMRIRVPELQAGRESLLACTLEDASTGRPIVDLEPYLGASAHLMVVSEDLADAMHSHPAAAISTASGPEIVFQVRFPRGGMYRLWTQVQRAGEVATFPFTVSVSPER